MLRVRNQIGCSDELVRSCGKSSVSIAMLDTGERVIVLSGRNSLAEALMKTGVCHETIRRRIS